MSQANFQRTKRQLHHHRYHRQRLRATDMDGAIIVCFYQVSCSFIWVNHQGLLWNVHCVATVVLRKQLNFKHAVIRSKRCSCHIALCSPIMSSLFNRTEMVGRLLRRLAFGGDGNPRREHPFLWWLFKSLCSTNFARQAEHWKGQWFLWFFLICRRNLRSRTVLLQFPTQHCTYLDAPLSDITCCTASRRVEKCLSGQLRQRKRFCDII